MKITLDIPPVSQCTVVDCAYNIDRNCRARAITVGNGIDPGCDTYFSTNAHTHRNQEVAGVGACKVTGCKFNDDFECAAKGINVGYQGSMVHCLTFSPR